VQDPACRNGRVDHARLDAMAAMTPIERLRWNDRWVRFVRACQQQGICVETAVYGTPPADEPG
jgi:hypothetical protein